MYKYSLAPHWKHYYKQFWRGGPHVVAYNHRLTFTDAGWPNDYSSWWIATKEAYNLKLYSKVPLKDIPCGGYLIPVTFFKEENIGGET